MYFKKEESELSSTWTVGKIAEIEKSKDGLVRRAEVQYQNFGESFPRSTDRAARSLIKLFHIDDRNWQDDMAEVEKLVNVLQDEDNDDITKSYVMNHSGDGLRFRLTATGGHDLVSREKGVQYKTSAKIARSKMLKSCDNCCCFSHCLLTEHCALGVLVSPQEFDFPGILDRSYNLETEMFEEEISHVVTENDPLMSLICAVNTDLAGDSAAGLVPGFN